jgi:hypothetical protein
MRILRQRRYWRAAIGLLMAYALCVQTLLGSDLAAQAAGAPSLADGLIICTSHSDGAADTDSGQPVKAGHCAYCLLAPLSDALAPARVAAPLRLATRSDPLPFVFGGTCVAFPVAKSNLSRGPPPTA